MVRLGLMLCVVALLGSARGVAQDIEWASEERHSIIDVMHAAEQCSTFLRVLEATGLAAQLEEEGPFTLFVPTDEAFDRLPPGAIEQLLRPENAGRLGRILAYHIVPGALNAERLSKAEVLRSLEDEELQPSNHRDLRINQAGIVEGEIEAVNGVVYFIDRVLLPPMRQVEREPG